jgi:uncharacterized membrane protein
MDSAWFQIDPVTLLAILGMGLVTYATRAGGFWLMSVFGRSRTGQQGASPRLEAWLSHIPGAVLISLVVPAALSEGPEEIIALVATVLVAWRAKNLLLAMVVGVGTVALLRYLNLF